MTALRFATTRVGPGPQLHYAEHGDSDGQAILFLHGWPDSWFSFSRVVPLVPQELHSSTPRASSAPHLWGTHSEASSRDEWPSPIPNELIDSS